MPRSPGEHTKLQLWKLIVQSLLDNVGWWLVQIHDLCESARLLNFMFISTDVKWTAKLSHGALIQLSENTDKPVMASTDEEALVSSLYSLITIKEHPNFDSVTFTKTISQEGCKHATTFVLALSQLCPYNIAHYVDFTIQISHYH